MEISPWLIYVVMQLDSVGVLFRCTSVVLFCIAVVLAVRALIAIDDKGIEGWKNKITQLIPAIASFMFFLILFVLACLLPSSKTAAAMYIIPKMASSEFVNYTAPAEMREMYSLAKQAIKNLSTDKEK